MKKNQITIANKKPTSLSFGFTIVELVVATAIFTIVVSAMMVLFNYTLKINRRSEALRQASQGMRDFVETLVKSVRNGEIDYGYADPGGTQQVSSQPNPCAPISDPIPANADGYGPRDNRLGLIDTDGNEECFYYGKDNGAYVDSLGSLPSTFSAPSDHSYTLVLAKGSLAPQILNPPNFSIDKLAFFIRPQKDPYSPGNSKGQPFVTILINFTAKLGSGEKVPIYYQTSVSTAKYDIPNSP